MLSVVYNPNVYSFQSYNPYEQLIVEQELQRRRQIEALQLRRQLQLAQLERRRQYEYARQMAQLRRRQDIEKELMTQHQCYRTVFEALRARRMAESTFARGRSGSPQERTMATDAERREGSEVLQSVTSNDDVTMPIPTSNTSIPTSKSSPSSSESQTDPIVEIETELPSTPNPSETSRSHTTISHILSSLATLKSDFTFPTQLDFAPPATPSSPKTAYTPANAPVHQYEHQLTGLLTQLDAVESHGDEDVRKARKEAVKAIEKELEELDGKKAEAWRRMTGHEEAVGEEVENSALMEMAINMDISQPEEPTTVADESQQEAAGCDSTVDPSCVPLPQDEEADESIYHPSSTSMSTPPNPTLVPPHSLMPSSPPLPPANITLANVTTSSSAPASSTSQLPRSSTSSIQPSPDADKPRQTSLNESTGSEISESELDEFVEIDADMDVETMSITSAEEVEQDKGLAAMSDWEVNF